MSVWVRQGGEHRVAACRGILYLAMVARLRRICRDRDGVPPAVTLPAAGLLASPAWAGAVLSRGAFDPPPVVWDSPSVDARGSMPLGNGDIALDAWVEPSGDLLFYIGKSDAWEDNSRLAKVGLVRLRLDPALLRPGDRFRQELEGIRDGEPGVPEARRLRQVRLLGELRRACRTRQGM